MNEEEKNAVEYSKNCLMKIAFGIDCEFDVNILEKLINLIDKLQEENEELKNDYENLNNSVVVKNHCIKNSIPVQKVKDKMEEYKNMLKTCNKVKDIDRIKAINERILELQELLKGRK